MRGIMKKIIFIVLLFLSSVPLLLAQHSAQPAGMNLELTPEKWREDLRFFASELPKRHREPFHAVTREKFEAAVKSLNDRIPVLKNEEIFCEFFKAFGIVRRRAYIDKRDGPFQSGFLPDAL